MDFGQVIEVLKQGGRVARKGWNGKGIFLGLQKSLPEVSNMTHDYIYIDTTGLQTDNPDAPKDRVPWLASQTDMLADDWYGIGEGIKKSVNEGTLGVYGATLKHTHIKPRKGKVTIDINVNGLDDLKEVLQQTNKNQADYLVKSLAAIHDYTNPSINYPGMNKSESSEDDG